MTRETEQDNALIAVCDEAFQANDEGNRLNEECDGMMPKCRKPAMPA
jgi:hypothetical protein